jgi:hypothetical protein
MGSPVHDSLSNILGHNIQLGLRPSYGASQQLYQPPGGIMGYVKEYFVKHRELLMGLAIFILLDHYIFNGAFKEKIQKLVHGILDQADKKLTHKEQS